MSKNDNNRHTTENMSQDGTELSVINHTLQKSLRKIVAARADLRLSEINNIMSARNLTHQDMLVPIRKSSEIANELFNLSGQIISVVDSRLSEHEKAAYKQLMKREKNLSPFFMNGTEHGCNITLLVDQISCEHSLSKTRSTTVEESMKYIDEMKVHLIQADELFRNGCEIIQTGNTSIFDSNTLYFVIKFHRESSRMCRDLDCANNRVVCNENPGQ